MLSPGVEFTKVVDEAKQSGRQVLCRRRDPGLLPGQRRTQCQHRRPTRRALLDQGGGELQFLSEQQNRRAVKPARRPIQGATMSVAVGRTLAPSTMAACMLDPYARMRWSWMIARHIGVIGAWHRLCTTATTGGRRFGIYRRRQQDGSKNFQHVFTLLVGMMTQQILNRFQRRASTRPQYLIWAIGSRPPLSCGSPRHRVRRSPRPEIGEAAPSLIVTALDGATFDLAKLRGKVVLVNYWATWWRTLPQGNAEARCVL